MESFTKSEEDSFSKDSNYTYEMRNKSNTSNLALVPNSSTEDYNYRVAYYIMKPEALKKEHPVWHYFYLCALIFAAFISFFIGPVIFGMLAAIGGLATPFVLSIVGGGLGLLFGIVFGIVFSVVCIVALVRALGWSAEWVLDTLWFGGNDLIDITKQHISTLINPQAPPRQQYQD